MRELYHLVYMSRAARPLTKAEVEDILLVARRRNEKAGITGLLLYAGDSFIQALEGTKADVEEIFASIARDDRHCWVTVLVRETIARRSFSEWSMGFQRLATKPENVEDIFQISARALGEKLKSAGPDVQDMILGFAESIPPSARA